MIIRRLKERALMGRCLLNDRMVEYKPLHEIKTCLAFAYADREGKEAIGRLAGRLKGIKVDKLYFATGNTDIIESDKVVILKKRICVSVEGYKMAITMRC